MNTITIAEIKRGGMTALDAVLCNGPAYLMKRNRPAAVVLTQGAYDALIQKSQSAADAQAITGIDWLLQQPFRDQAVQGLSAGALRAQLHREREDWADSAVVGDVIQSAVHT